MANLGMCLPCSFCTPIYLHTCGTLQATVSRELAIAKAKSHVLPYHGPNISRALTISSLFASLSLSIHICIHVHTHTFAYLYFHYPYVFIYDCLLLRILTSTCSCSFICINPEGPSTQHLRTLVPKPINGMASEPRVLKYWVLGPFGSKSSYSLLWPVYGPISPKGPFKGSLYFGAGLNPDSMQIAPAWPSASRGRLSGQRPPGARTPLASRGFAELQIPEQSLKDPSKALWSVDIYTHAYIYIYIIYTCMLFHVDG